MKWDKMRSANDRTIGAMKTRTPYSSNQDFGSGDVGDVHKARAREPRTKLSGQDCGFVTAAYYTRSLDLLTAQKEPREPRELREPTRILLVSCIYLYLPVSTCITVLSI